MNKLIRKLLYRSLDVKLSSEDQKSLSAAVSKSTELRQEQEELLRMRTVVAAARIESFRPLFAERVLADITRPRVVAAEPELFDALKLMFRPLGIAVTLALVGLLIYNISSYGYFSIETLIGMPELTIDNIALAIQ